MATVLRERYQIAKKDHPCDACENLYGSDAFSDPKELGFSFADMRILVKIKQEGYKVLKGTRYLYQVGIFDGFYSAHCRLDAVYLNQKYDLYEDW